MEACVDGPTGIALELLTDRNDRVGVEVDVGEEPTADAPLVKGDQRDVLEFGVALTLERFQGLGRNSGGAAELALLSFDGDFRRVAHVIVEAVGSLGSNRARTIDNQLLEVPFAGGRVGDLRLPDSVFRGLETADGFSARYDG